MKPKFNGSEQFRTGTLFNFLFYSELYHEFPSVKSSLVIYIVTEFISETFCDRRSWSGPVRLV